MNKEIVQRRFRESQANFQIRYKDPPAKFFFYKYEK